MHQFFSSDRHIVEWPLPSAGLELRSFVGVGEVFRIRVILNEVNSKHINQSAKRFERQITLSLSCYYWQLNKTLNCSNPSMGNVLFYNHIHTSPFNCVDKLWNIKIDKWIKRVQSSMWGGWERVCVCVCLCAGMCANVRACVFCPPFLQNFLPLICLFRNVKWAI